MPAARTTLMTGDLVSDTAGSSGSNVLALLCPDKCHSVTSSRTSFRALAHSTHQVEPHESKLSCNNATMSEHIFQNFTMEVFENFFSLSSGQGKLLILQHIWFYSIIYISKEIQHKLRHFNQTNLIQCFKTNICPNVGWISLLI